MPERVRRGEKGKGRGKSAFSAPEREEVSEEEVGERVGGRGSESEDQSVRRRRAVCVQRRGKEALIRSARMGVGRGR